MGEILHIQGEIHGEFVSQIPNWDSISCVFVLIVLANSIPKKVGLHLYTCNATKIYNKVKPRGVIKHFRNTTTSCFPRNKFLAEM